jgi:hypothetical protein
MKKFIAAWCFLRHTSQFCWVGAQAGCRHCLVGR